MNNNQRKKRKGNRKNLPPEDLFDKPQDYYKGEILKQYTHSKSLMRIQERLTKRALNIISPECPSLVLDLGAGCGFSASYLYLNNFSVISLDLIFKMLIEYDISELNPINADMKFLPFRENSFDYIFSISAIQWIINKFPIEKLKKILIQMSMDLKRVLKPNGKCIIQFYPKDESILKEMGIIFSDYGKFEGHFIIDNPNSLIKKRYYLYLKNNK